MNAWGALILSIFLAPLGIEGYVLRSSCKNLSDGVRNVALGSSIAKHVILGLLVVSTAWFIHKFSDNFLSFGGKESNDNVDTHEISAVAIMGLGAAMGITSIVAFVNCIVALQQC